jgi:hypothetical protein
MSPEQAADRGGADADADLAKLTLNPHVTPARVLPGEAQDGLTKLRVDRRATVKGANTRIPSRCELVLVDQPAQQIATDHGFRQAGPQTWASMKPSTRCQASRHARSCAANLRSKNECGALS